MVTDRLVQSQLLLKLWATFKAGTETAYRLTGSKLGGPKHAQQNPSFAVPFDYVLFPEHLSLSEMDHDESRSFTRASLSNFAEARISPTVKCFLKSNLKLFSAGPREGPRCRLNCENVPRRLSVTNWVKQPDLPNCKERTTGLWQGNNLISNVMASRNWGRFS